MPHEHLIEKARDAVQAIKAASFDPEAAHSMEDGVRCEFLQYVADAKLGDISEAAKILLETEEIDFPRWSA